MEEFPLKRTDEEVDMNLDFIRGQYLLEKFVTVDDYIRFWLSVGPFWMRYSPNEKLKPWFKGLERQIKSAIAD